MENLQSVECVFINEREGGVQNAWAKYSDIRVGRYYDLKQSISEI